MATTESRVAFWSAHYRARIAGTPAFATREFNREQVRLMADQLSPFIDVLLTDVVMPGVSGPERARKLAERWPDLRVIYMSGYTDDTIGLHGGLDPGGAFLHKPFTSQTLVEKIREVLTR
jgi:FixJ family two-component response regulator